jgi:uncharacterized LabA/DUF88 family protein
MAGYALFVDAGYFFQAGWGSTQFSQSSRKNISIKNPEQMLSELCQKAASLADNTRLLRVYWYDAIPGPRLSLEQTQLAKLKGLKLRLGTLNSEGQQKGVDSLIVTDILELARNKAIEDAVIVTGDEDLRIAVEIAQTYGVRVHVLAAGDYTKNVSLQLQMEADSVDTIAGEWFESHLTSTTLDPLVASSARVNKASSETIDIDLAANGVITDMLAAMSEQEKLDLTEHFSSSTSVPIDFDGKLIKRTSEKLDGARLTPAQCRRIRGLFVTALKNKS